MPDIAQNYSVGLPVQASTYAADVDHALRVIHTEMAVLFAAGLLLFVYCLWRFRPGKRPASTAPKGWLALAPSAVVLVSELILIFSLGLPVWSRIKVNFPPEAQSNVVEVVAEQFAWNFHYPGPDGKFGRTNARLISGDNLIGLDRSDPAAADDVVSVNELHVPLGQPTLLYLTSKDVIHSFFVPEFRVKQDAVPGLRVPLWFEPTRAGEFEIGCAQLCGLGHYRMKGRVIAHPPAEFAAALRALKS